MVRGGRHVGAERKMTFTRTAAPVAGLLAHLDCESLQDGQTPVRHGGGATALVTGGELVEGKNGKALRQKFQLRAKGTTGQRDMDRFFLLCE